MTLNHDGSLLAVAFGKKIALLSNWLSGKWFEIFAQSFAGFDVLLDSDDNAQVSYLSMNGLVSEKLLGIPQNIHFLDEFTILVSFLERVMYVTHSFVNLC
jgi:hypothetical protein